MQIGSFDLYRQAESRIHRLDPRVKVAFTVLFIVSNALLLDDAWPAFALAWAVILLVGDLAGFSPLFVLKRSFVALPFALAAVTAIFTLPGEPLAAFSVGRWQAVVTEAGLIRFAGIVIRSWLSIQMAILLTAATRFSDLMHALRHLRIPPSLVAIISFTYRYLFVLADEAGRLIRAREARSAALPGMRGGGSIGWRAKIAGNMVGQLFLRSYQRSDRVYNAMLARGYRGHFQTLNPHLMRRQDWIAAAGGICLLLLIQLAGRLTL